MTTDDVASVRASRRTVLAAGAAAALAGCSKYGDEGGGGEAPTAPSATATPGSPTPAEPEPSGDGPTSGKPPKGEASSEQPPAGEELAKTSDVEVGGGKIFKDKKIVVTQPTAGDFKAFSAVCTHAGCTVNDVSGGTINCPCHGSKYRIADAAVADGPAPAPLSPQQITVSGDSIRLP
ncbi:Rieske (2Fe-2S) protein [Streptomyces sp. NBC_01304]|uniref:Rieske (2Fe-2S) protein n=1 Tax=Streptomyces sp. NBC_01304 TaxID=2903818 RepID=UPI002E116889|nr:Rieske 2Fe-2S domain-containing protein [Streptomyces sp. NBC_01304]